MIENVDFDFFNFELIKIWTLRDSHPQSYPSDLIKSGKSRACARYTRLAQRMSI